MKSKKAHLLEQIAMEKAKKDQALIEKLWTHIAMGELNKDGDPVGYHWKGNPKSILEGFGEKSAEGKCGVYQQRVRHKGNKKEKSNKSTFFPDLWKEQDVKDALTSASHRRVGKYGEASKPEDANGLRIDFMGDGSTAFPIYEEKEEGKK
jgi:hypothetical protein